MKVLSVTGSWNNYRLKALMIVLKHCFGMTTNKVMLVCVVISDAGYLGRGQAGVHSEGGERKPWLETVDGGRPATPGERKHDTLVKS